MINMESTYDPTRYESKWYAFWLNKKLFRSIPDTKKKPYTILMPPPNVTAQLHMGHGTGYTIQDIFIRWKRMHGFNALWLPGTDHAGIATQMMVEKELFETQKKTRQQVGREAFVKMLEQWRLKHGSIILEQFKQMGFSCDWDRVAYTMDPKLNIAVRYVFVKLYQEGLIYRGKRLVNWDTELKTAVSDDEVENKEISGFLYHLRYPIKGSDEFITIATTRPETMLGDTAVAVHPEDSRFQRLIGKKVLLPLANREIPVVGDAYVKTEFGTGAVKITPAHDFNDFELAKRHNLALIDILNDDGTLNENVPKAFQGVDRLEARKQVINALKKLELYEDAKPYKYSAPHSDRSKTVIEPKLSLQWFIKMPELAKPAGEVARSGRLKFYPDSWKKTYLYWLDNIQDWCISRQLWWGHRIPIWYCKDCSEYSTGMADPTKCAHCSSKNIYQDEDVLDTWFSSQLWPLSPFGWPNPSKEEQRDLDYYYPTDVLITGPDIIFLWVARMVMMGMKFKNEVPYHDVYLSAIVCDKQGRKFSKTLGNGIDPLDVIKKHGADAVRYTAVSLAPLGGRVRMDIADFEHGARFINKLWNASRFLLNYVDKNEQLLSFAKLELDLPSKWLVTELHDTAGRIDHLFSKYRLNEGIEELYHFIWGGFCDWAIECSKDILNSNDKQKQHIISVLVYTLDCALRLAHPVIPFVTEEIWQKLPKHPDLDRPESIVIAKYPEAKVIPSFEKEAQDWRKVQDLISGVRSAKTQAGIPPGKSISLCVRADQSLLDLFKGCGGWIKKLCHADEFEAKLDLKQPPQSLVHVAQGFEAFIPATGLIDIEKEKKRLEQELLRLRKIITGLQNKLDNPEFKERAPQEILTQTFLQKENLSSQLKNIENSLKAMN